MKDIDKLKEQYDDIKIPEDLDFSIRSAITNQKKKIRRKKLLKQTLAIAASLAAIFIIVVNTSPQAVYAISEMPFIGSMAKVVLIREYKIEDRNFEADLKTPSLQGLENKELEDTINEKYFTENKKLYEDFQQEIKELEDAGQTEGHMGIDSGYQVVTDNEKILAIERYVLNTAGSSSTVLKYDTLDKKREILITLPSLFKDKRYVDIISENIKEQMRAKMKDEEKVYWLDDEMMGDENFRSIAEDQSFYINNQEELVISFDKYEIAPGYMGNPEFIIPSDILKDILVSTEYIK